MTEQTDDEQARVKALRRWVKAEVTAPVPWAAVEQRLLAEPVPPRAALEEMFGSAGRSRVWLLVGMLPQLVLVNGALIGLGFVVAAVWFDAAPSPDWAFVVPLCFIGAILVLVVPLLNWWDSKRREVFGVTVAIASFLLLTPAWLLARSEPRISPTTERLAGGGALLALVEAALLLLVARSAVPMTVAERTARATPEDLYHRALRGIVLHELVQRGLVHRADVHDLVHLPRGAWSEVVSTPDGRVDRRPQR